MDTIMPIVLSLISGVAGNAIYDKIKSYIPLLQNPSLEDKVKIAYKSALGAWSTNSLIREKYALSQDKFQQYLDGTITLNPFDLSYEEQQLLGYFKAELEKDTDTLVLLNYIQNQQTLKTVVDMREGQNLLAQTQMNCHTELMQVLAEIKSTLPIIEPVDANIIPNNYFIKDMRALSNYIPRRLTEVLSNGANILYSLEDLVKQEHSNHIAILGSAALGKTTELKQTAIRIAEGGRMFPIFISLNQYDPNLQTIETLLPIEWVKVSENHIVLFLDGYDEIQQDKSLTAKRHIIAFAEQHPTVKIVLSSRTNFYELPSKDDKTGGTIKNFIPYFLQPLCRADISSFLKRAYGIDYEPFMKEVIKHDYENLIDNPFYLNAIADYYSIREGVLPPYKGEIIKALIDKRLSHDIDHFMETRDIKDEHPDLFRLLRKIAGCMSVAGIRVVDEENLRKVIPNREDWNLVKCGTTFIKDRESWLFEHGNFQEYMTAQLLSGQSFETIKSLITGSGSGQILPAWQNTINFLLGILNPTSELCNKILDHYRDIDPMALLGIESDKLTHELRKRIFETVFDYYKQRKIWISHSPKLDMSLYGQFGCSDMCVDYMLSEALSQDNDRIVRINALLVLKEMNFAEYNNRNDASSVLINSIKNITEGSWINDTINVILEIDSYSQEDVESLFEMLGHRNNEYVRTALYELIIKEKLGDKYIDYLLHGLSFIHHNLHDKETTDRENVHMGEDRYLRLALGTCALFSSFEKIVRYIFDERHMRYSFFDGNDFLEVITKSAIFHYNAGEEGAIKWMLRLIEKVLLHHNNVLPTLLTFFSETKTQNGAIQKILVSTNDHFYKAWLLPHFVDIDNYHLIFNAFIQGVITEDSYRGICNLFYHRDKDICNRLIEDARTNMDIEIIIEPPFDWDAYRAKRSQEGFDILFDKERLRKECIAIVKEHEPITKKKLNQIDIATHEGGYKGRVINSAVWNLLIAFMDDEKSVSSDKIDKWFQQEANVDYWIIFQIIEKVKGRNKKDEQKYELEISEAQIKYMQDWFDANIRSVDFATATKRTSEKQFTVNSMAVLVISLMQSMEFDCPDDVLLEMTHCCLATIDWGLTLEDIRLRIFDMSLLDARIVDNIINDKIELDHVLREHMEYAFKYDLSDAYDFIFRTLPRHEDDDYLRAHILDAYSGAKRGTGHCLKHWNLYNIETKLQIAKYLATAEMFDFIRQELPLLYSEANEEQRETINSFLILSGDIRGLENSINWINNTKRSPFSQHDKLLTHFESLEALPCLLQLLEISYDKTVAMPHMLDSMTPLVVNGITHLGLAKKENYSEVIKCLHGFIDMHKDKLEHVEFLNSHIEMLHAEYDKKYSQTYSFQEAISIINRLPQS
ncbi:hypothetical protein LJC45_01090 [Alistipes sp. OttesenSCG-928-B03]|nr:hypothetical protein [Alistipes sp. OttesenSCG-928-B03]